MNKEALLKIGLIQAIGFLLYIVGVFSVSLMEVEHTLTYFLIGLLMIILIIVNGVYLVFYVIRGMKNG